MSSYSPKFKNQGGVRDTLNCDPKRELIWKLSNYKNIYALKLDPIVNEK